MERARPTYVVSLYPLEDRWAWKVAPSEGVQVSGQAQSFAAARRSAAFAEAVLRSLDRARRRRT